MSKTTIRLLEQEKEKKISVNINIEIEDISNPRSYGEELRKLAIQSKRNESPNAVSIEVLLEQLATIIDHEIKKN